MKNKEELLQAKTEEEFNAYLLKNYPEYDEIPIFLAINLLIYCSLIFTNKFSAIFQMIQDYTISILCFFKIKEFIILK